MIRPPKEATIDPATLMQRIDQIAALKVTLEKRLMVAFLLGHSIESLPDELWRQGELQ